MTNHDDRALLEAAAIDTADHIHHEPSGEEWLVAYVRGDHVVCCGWPESAAKLSDCRLVRKASRAERHCLLIDMAGSGAGGSRGSYAIWRLTNDPTFDDPLYGVRAAAALAPASKEKT
jgi:hypothetical protein